MHRALIHENDDATIDVRTHGSIKVERSATPDHHGEGRRSRRMAKVGRKRRAESCFHVCRPLFSRFSRESLPSSKYVIDEADRRRKIERLLSSSSPPPVSKGEKIFNPTPLPLFSRSPFIRDFPLAFSFCFSSLFASEEKRKENRELRRFSREVLNLDWELLSILWRGGEGGGGRFRFVSHAIVGQVGELMMRV